MRGIETAARVGFWGDGMTAVRRPELGADDLERKFILFVASLLIGVSVIGFGYFLLSGKSTFASPWWVHVHAVSMVAWLGFFVVQNLAVVTGRMALHRRLGWFGAVYAVGLVLGGYVVGWVEVSSGRNMPFDPPESLALNWMNITTFAGLFVAAIHLRRRPDWHKRLMLCAMICLTAPAYGRTLIMLDARTNTNFTLFMLALIAIAALGDLAIRRRIHAAYLWGFAAAAAMGALIGGLPMLGPFTDFANSMAK